MKKDLKHSDYYLRMDWDLFGYACKIVAAANMATSEDLLIDAQELERLSITEYYDDVEGCKLLANIAGYLKLRAQ